MIPIQIEAGLAFALEGAHDCVIGFGGGSPLDSAKAIAVLAVHGGHMRDYKTPHLQQQAGLPIIACDTDFARRCDCISAVPVASICLPCALARPNA